MTTDQTQQPTMEELLAEEGRDLIELGRGDVVEGIVVGREGPSIIVDVGAKSEGVVTTNEMHSLTPDQRDAIQVGHAILVYVLQPDSEDGQMMLSVDRARGEQGWRELQAKFESGDIFEAIVAGFNKGGLLVNVEGVNAFVPLSQVMGAAPETETSGGNLNEFVGRPLRLKVIEINRRRNRVILSERAAMQEWRAEQKDRLLAELRESEIRRGHITSIRSFGVFVDLGGADGLVHLSELSWERDINPEEQFKVGQDVDVYVMKVDQESKKIGLSIRRARPEQWDEVVAEYEVGQVAPGQVTKLVTFGAFVRIDGPVEGLIHVSELVDRRITHPREVVNENEVVPVKIVRIERDRHRLGLSLRQARVEAERDGWIFNEDGGIAWIPPAVAEKFGVEQADAPPPPPPEPVAQGEPAAEAGEPSAAATPAEARPAQVQEKPQTAMEAALERAGLSGQDLSGHDS
ncbi:MAG TPA: S1 RNA-binding domain-containing protein [Dehalococcoidia bacterium]|nr:S1 RNA-binding domain-containing protein [Dehalococcoidia bacterium]